MEIPIHFYAKVIWNESTESFQWIDYETVIAQGTISLDSPNRRKIICLAYDYPVPGYKNNVIIINDFMNLFIACRL